MSDDRQASLQAQSIKIAKAFHLTYETLAPSYGWKTQVASQQSWDNLPESNRDLMIATISNLLLAGTIK